VLFVFPPFPSPPELIGIEPRPNPIGDKAGEQNGEQNKDYETISEKHSGNTCHVCDWASLNHVYARLSQEGYGQHATAASKRDRYQSLHGCPMFLSLQRLSNEPIEAR
jgi:hypothetical protein